MQISNIYKSKQTLLEKILKTRFVLKTTYFSGSERILPRNAPETDSLIKQTL